MASTSLNFIGNLSAQDAATSLSVTGLSRIVEIPYVSSPISVFLGNFLAVDKLLLSLGTGSRIVEIGIRVCTRELTWC